MQNTNVEMFKLAQKTGNASPELTTTGQSTSVVHTRPSATPPMSVPAASPTNDKETDKYEDAQLFETLIGSPRVLKNGAGIKALEACRNQEGRIQSPSLIPSTAAVCPSPVNLGNASTLGFFSSNGALAQPVAQRVPVRITGFAAPYGK